jgi:hypothetical protein
MSMIIIKGYGFKTSFDQILIEMIITELSIMTAFFCPKKEVGGGINTFEGVH